jgi:hypothetical protein
MLVTIGNLISPTNSTGLLLLYDPGIKQFYVGTRSSTKMRKVNITKDNINKLTFEHQKIKLNKEAFEQYVGWDKI